MFGFGQLSPIGAITPLGMKILGIFIALIYCWSTVGIIWPSLIGILAVGFTGYDTVNDAIKNAMGNDTVWQLFFIMAMLVPIEAEGVANHISKFILTADDYLGDNLMFMTPSLNSHPVAYDHNGEIRWYLTELFNFDIKRAKNGNLLYGSPRFVHAPYHTAGLCEMTIGGKILKEYRIPGGYHHDHFEMPDGNLLILTQDLDSGTLEDMCVLVDRQTGDILKTWDYKDVLPTDVASSGSRTDHDWFHNNSVWYDEKTDSIVLSGRHQDAIVCLDFQTGALKWIIGDPEGWPQDMVERYFFTPIGDLDHFDWQYEQHAAVVLPDGDIMCFDNGHWRSKNPQHYLKNRDNFSRGVRYRIDTERKTIEQVWQYGKERKAEFFSPYISNVEYYRDSYYLVHSGGIAYFKGEVAESLGSRLGRGKDKAYVDLYAKTVEIKDGEVVFEMIVPANMYRAEKMPLYHASERFQPGPGQYLGSLGPSRTMRGKLSLANAAPLPETVSLTIEEEFDRINLGGHFNEGDYVVFVLTADGGDPLYYPLKTVTVNFTAMCVGSFQNEDRSYFQHFINKDGLAPGHYRLDVFVEDTYYHTGFTWQI
ncbi:MAG: aryl-sulfate sulfotransferase [Peptococcaceae bacterium]|nr:aryl-sulfate sulfotransferase [Peptococcaceae bacterium]